MKKDLIKFADHHNERISRIEQNEEERNNNMCTIVTYYACSSWGKEKRTQIEINDENIKFINKNISRNQMRKEHIKELKDQIKDLLGQNGEFDPYWVELYKHQTDYKAFVTEENEVYEIVGTGNDTVTYYAGNRKFENVKVEYRGKMPRNMYFWKAKLSKGANKKETDNMMINEIEKGDKMKNINKENKVIVEIIQERMAKGEITPSGFELSCESLKEGFEQAKKEYPEEMKEIISSTPVKNGFETIMAYLRKLDKEFAIRYLNEEIHRGEFDHVRAHMTIQGALFSSYVLGEKTFFEPISLAASQKFLKEEEEAYSSSE